MRKFIILLNALCAVLAIWSIALALSTVTIAVSLTYPTGDATHSLANGLTVQYRSDGGTWATYCSMITPATTCTGAALPIGHVYDLQGFASNAFGNSTGMIAIGTVTAFPPAGPGLPNPPYSITVQ